jgi:hypothetical protein
VIAYNFVPFLSITGTGAKTVARLGKTINSYTKGGLLNPALYANGVSTV